MRVSLPYLASALALAASLACSPMAALAQSAAADAEGIVVYNAQHESLTQAWADGFTRETGIKVTLRNGSDTELGNQIVQEGAASPADVFLTENSPAMALVDDAGLFAPLDARDAGAGAGELPAGQRPLGRHRRAQHRVRLRQDQAQRRPAAEVAARPRRSGVEGPLGRLAVGRRFPGDRQRAARTQGRGRDAAWLQGHEGERHRLQGQQRRHEGGQCRRGRRRGDLPLLLFRRSGEDRREQQATSRCTISATRIRAPSSASPAAACWPRASTRRRRRRS